MEQGLHKADETVTAQTDTEAARGSSDDERNRSKNRDNFSTKSLFLNYIFSREKLKIVLHLLGSCRTLRSSVIGQCM